MCDRLVFSSTFVDSLSLEVAAALDRERECVLPEQPTTLMVLPDYVHPKLPHNAPTRDFPRHLERVESDGLS